MREPHNAGCLPIRFNIGGLPIVQCDDPRSPNSLCSSARAREAVAQLWQAPQGFVVPAVTGNSPIWPPSVNPLPPVAGRCGCVDPEAGWCRRGPILNLSLAWPVIQPLGEAAEPIYLLLCGILQRTLSTLGVESHFQAVSGSFATAAIIWPAVREKTRARLPVPLNTGGP